MSKTILSKEEFETLMSKQNLTPSEIAAIAMYLKESRSTEDDKSTALESSNKAKTIPVYTLVSSSYPDFVIEKKSAKQTKTLCISPSCETGGLFIKTLRNNGSWDIEELTETNYSNFMSDCKDEIKLPENYWISTLNTGVSFGRKLIKYLNQKHFREMIRKKCFTKFNIDLEERDLKGIADIYEAIPVLVQKYARSEDPTIQNFFNLERYYTSNNYKFVWYLQEVYGLEKAIDFIESCPLSPFDLSNVLWTRYERPEFLNNDLELYKIILKINHQPSSFQPNNYNSLVVPLFPIFQMEYERFKQYILYDSYSFGYADISSFFSDWRDYISMSKTIDGKIKEKYPMDLPIAHLKLSRIRYYSNRFYNIEDFKKMSENNKKYAFSPIDSKYIFKVPQTFAEFQDEANMQSNCLVNCNYAKKVAEGTSIIVFMREKLSPDQSCVTIEIKHDPSLNSMRITQAYRAFNRLPNASEDQALRQYADHFNLIYTRRW